MKKKLIILLIFFFTYTLSLNAELDITASSAILIDYTTGRIIYQKNPDERIPPASMTKLVTLYIIYDMIDQEKINEFDTVTINYAVSAEGMKPGSSLMGLHAGDQLTVHDLMLGIAVASGNDASYALADYTAGSALNFIELMNRYVSDMGYKNMHFVDPDGWSEENIITAREFAFFSKDYIERFPRALPELHSVTELSGKYNKKNTNLLLGRVEGVDGLKTGHIPESGFNFTATARRKLTRFISVVMGIQSPDFRTGLIIRAEESAALLEYGFQNYSTLYLKESKPVKVRIRKGKKDFIEAGPESYPLFTLSGSESETGIMIINANEDVKAPVSEGDVIGSVTFWNEYSQETVDILARENIEKAGLFSIIWRKIIGLPGY